MYFIEYEDYCELILDVTWNEATITSFKIPFEHSSRLETNLSAIISSTSVEIRIVYLPIASQGDYVALYAHQ
jgi:hypothetical protein